MNIAEGYDARLVIKERLKENIFKAQRLYYLSQKLEDRVPQSIRNFSMNILNNYIKDAKKIDLQLTIEELYDRLIDD